MAKIVSAIVGLLALVAMAGGVGWAQQREAKLMRGPMSPMVEQPTLVACTPDRIRYCNDVVPQQCTRQCSGGANHACDQCQTAYMQLCHLGCS